MHRIAPVAGVVVLLVANGAILWSFRSSLVEQRRALSALTSAVGELRGAPVAPAVQVPRTPAGSPMFCSDRVDVLASVIAEHLKGSEPPAANGKARGPATEPHPDEQGADEAPATPEDTRAFDEVTRLVDDAIRSGTLSPETSVKIHELKARANRPQDFSELNLRIAAAINRGQLSLQKGEVTLP